MEGLADCHSGLLMGHQYAIGATGTFKLLIYRKDTTSACTSHIFLSQQGLLSHHVVLPLFAAVFELPFQTDFSSRSVSTVMQYTELIHKPSIVISEKLRWLGIVKQAEASSRHQQSYSTNQHVLMCFSQTMHNVIVSLLRSHWEGALTLWRSDMRIIIKTYGEFKIQEHRPDLTFLILIKLYDNDGFDRWIWLEGNYNFFLAW